MAITATPVITGQNMFVANIVSSADADTTQALPHGLPVAPIITIIAPTIGAAAAFAAWCQWAVTAVTATNVTVSKVGTAGTAANSAAVLVCLAPHSIIK